jgi:O-antigen/teichoic acid export membrane protein
VKKEDILSHIRAYSSSKTIRSISTIFSTNVVNAALGFFVSVLVLRNLDSDHIGTLYPLVSLLLILNQVGDLGLSSVFIKLGSKFYIPEPAKSLRFFAAFFKLKLIFVTLILGVGLMMAPIIGEWIFHHREHSNWIRIVVLMSVFQIFTSYFQCSLQIQSKFKALALSKLIPQLIKFLIILYFALTNDLQLKYAFIAFMAIPVGAFIISFFTAAKKEHFSLKNYPEENKDILGVGKWVFLSVLSNVLMGQSDVLMTRSLVGAAELSKYLGGQRLSSVLPMVTLSLMTVLLPKVSAMKSTQELNYFFRKSIKLLLVMALAMLCLIPLAPYFIPTLLGEKYVSSISIFNAFLVTHAIGLLITPLSLMFYQLDKEHVMAKVNVAQALINITGNYFLIPIYGAIATAGTTLLSKLLAGVVVYYILYKTGVLTAHKGTDK